MKRTTSIIATGIATLVIGGAIGVAAAPTIKVIVNNKAFTDVKEIGGQAYVNLKKISAVLNATTTVSGKTYAVQSRPTSTPFPLVTPTPQIVYVTPTPMSKQEAISFSNFVSHTDYGMTTFEGEAKNNDTTEHSFTITVSYYDANGKLLGTGTGSVSKISPGDTKTFTAISTKDFSQAASQKVQVDSMF